MKATGEKLSALNAAIRAISAAQNATEVVWWVCSLVALTLVLLRGVTALSGVLWFAVSFFGCWLARYVAGRIVARRQERVIEARYPGVFGDK